MIVIKADKGNTAVVMNKREYIEKTEQFIQKGPDYTSKFQAQTKKLIKKTTYLTEWEKKQKIEHNPEAPKFRCQIKLHKKEMPLRPIVSIY